MNISDLILESVYKDSGLGKWFSKNEQEESNPKFKEDYIINDDDESQIDEIGDLLIKFKYNKKTSLSDLKDFLLIYVFNKDTIRNKIEKNISNKIVNTYNIHFWFKEIKNFLIRSNVVKETFLVDGYPTWEKVNKYALNNNLNENNTKKLSSFLLEYYWGTKNVDYVDIINNELKNTKQELFIDTATPLKSKYINKYVKHPCGCEDIELIDGIIPIHLLYGKILSKDSIIEEGFYKGEDVDLNKPKRGGSKKYYVYVNSGKKDSKGRIKAKKVSFGDPNMEIKRDDPENRKNFRARHNCADKKDKKTAGYWSCKFWSDTPVSQLLEMNNSRGALKEDSYELTPKMPEDKKRNAFYHQGNNVDWFSNNNNLVLVDKDDLTEIIGGNAWNNDKLQSFVKQIKNSPEKVEFEAPLAYVDEITFDDFLSQNDNAGLTYLDGRELTTGDLELDDYISKENIDEVDGLEYVDDEVIEVMEKYRFAGSSLKYDSNKLKIALDDADIDNDNKEEIELFIELENNLNNAIKNKEGDIGNLRFQLRDGHHRALSAIKSGEEFIALDITKDGFSEFGDKLDKVTDVYKSLEENIEISEDYPNNWDTNKFLNLPNKTQRLKYAKKHLKKLGCGTARCVFDVDGEKVLKIANKAGNYNQGTEQNRVEVDVSTSEWYDIVPKVYNYDSDDYIWVEMEKLRPIRSEKEFEKYAGVSMDRLKRFLESIRKNTKEDFSDLWDEDKMTYSLIDMVGNFGITIGDVVRYTHWGLDEENKLKIFDYGLTDDIYGRFYRK